MINSTASLAGSMEVARLPGYEAQEDWVSRGGCSLSGVSGKRIEMEAQTPSARREPRQEHTQECSGINKPFAGRYEKYCVKVNG